jgi:hypothetical protein
MTQPSYCPRCCMRNDTRDGLCVLCGNPCAPDNPDVCPRATDGKHLAHRQADGSYRCAQCNYGPMPEPADANVVVLGSIHRH